MSRRHRARGFSIIELSVALTIAGVLLALGAPAFSGYLQNARLGTMAQSIYSGVQTARAEAVKRNQAVQFVLTSTALTASNADAVAADAAGRNWVVRQRASATAAYQLVEQKANAGSDVGGIVVAASAASIDFNSLGGTGGAATTISLTNPAVGACVPTGPVRCWNVVVSVGGQARLCSPDSTLASTDSRACPP